LVIVVVSVATWALEHAGFFDRFATPWLDSFNVLQQPKDPSDVVIIAINDTEYMSMFGGTSPLPCEPLRDILSAIAAAKPLVIGVDLDTAASPHFDCLRADDTWPPIVWAAEAIPKDGTLSAIPVFTESRPARTLDVIGIALVPQDGDGVIRRHQRLFSMAGGASAPSFPWAVIEAGCGLSSPTCETCCHATREAANDSEKSLRLNFAGERFAFRPLSVQPVLEGSTSAGWSAQGLLTGKIVVLGGYYRQARDAQLTPVGNLSGVQIVAQAIVSELHGGGIRPVNEGVAIALDVLAGFTLFFINASMRSRPVKAFLLSIIVIPLFCFFGSLAAFSTLTRWVNFVPMVASVLIHQTYEHLREFERLKRLERQLAAGPR
jgi:CHASE2 domain-containing sensor protein